MRASRTRAIGRATTGALAALLLAAPALADVAGHANVTLRGPEGGTIAASDTVPYSPKETCGRCHTYETVTKGYHFQQGYDVIADQFNEAKPWILSPGMVGKW